MLSRLPPLNLRKSPSKGEIIMPFQTSGKGLCAEVHGAFEVEPELLSAASQSTFSALSPREAPEGSDGDQREAEKRSLPPRSRLFPGP